MSPSLGIYKSSGPTTLPRRGKPSRCGEPGRGGPCSAAGEGIDDHGPCRELRSRRRPLRPEAVSCVQTAPTGYRGIAFGAAGTRVQCAAGRLLAGARAGTTSSVTAHANPWNAWRAANPGLRGGAPEAQPDTRPGYPAPATSIGCRRGRSGPENRVGTAGCACIDAVRDASPACRFALDNYCYRAQYRGPRSLPPITRTSHRGRSSAAISRNS